MQLIIIFKNRCNFEIMWSIGKPNRDWPVSYSVCDEHLSFTLSSIPFIFGNAMHISNSPTLLLSWSLPYLHYNLNTCSPDGRQKRDGLEYCDMSGHVQTTVMRTVPLDDTGAVDKSLALMTFIIMTGPPAQDVRRSCWTRTKKKEGRRNKLSEGRSFISVD